MLNIDGHLYILQFSTDLVQNLNRRAYRRDKLESKVKMQIVGGHFENLQFFTNVLQNQYTGGEEGRAEFDIWPKCSISAAILL